MQYYTVKVMFTRFPIKILVLSVISTATGDFASSVHHLADFPSSAICMLALSLYSQQQFSSELRFFSLPVAIVCSGLNGHVLYHHARLTLYLLLFFFLFFPFSF